MTNRELLSFARDLAALGGRLALGHFRRSPHAEQKKDGSWVTEADWAVEAQIRLRIARTFPEHNVLGEEEGLTAAGGGPPTEGAPTWIVDPIDGTNNFIAGIPIWGTLVALNVDGRNTVGVAHAPALGETYAGAEGAGATLNDRPIHVSDTAELSGALLLYCGIKRMQGYGLDPLLGELATRVTRSRAFGDFWGHMLVARGAAEIMLEPELSAWDAAALEPIVTEAGGRLTHLDGSPWDGSGSVLTTNGKLHDAVVTLASTHPLRRP